MDIIIPLGKSSKWNNNEIKFTIRGLEKFSINGFDNVYIIGEKPNFFDWTNPKLIHIPFFEHRAKEVNIWEKILCASNDERISEEFFFCNDDHFFLKEFSMEEFPHYHKGDLREFEWANMETKFIQNSYHKIAKRTMNYLLKMGYTTYHFDTHTPNRYEKSKFINTYNFFKKELYKGNGLTISNCYGNYNKLDPTYMEDVKIKKDKIKWLKEEEKNKKLLIFSIFDNAQDDELLDFMNEIYPNKSQFEK